MRNFRSTSWTIAARMAALPVILGTAAAPARAQSDDARAPRAPAASATVGLAPAASAMDPGPAPLGRDATVIGGSPFDDSSPRLPRVDYGTALVAPAATRAGQVRGTSVMGRSRPDYDPTGLRAGGFVILPEISVRAGYESNVFSQPSPRDDVFGRVRGAVVAASDWGRHAVTLNGFVDQRVYGKYGTESGLTYSAGAAGRLDVGRTSTLRGGVQHARVFIERGASSEILSTRRPIRYDLTSANIGAHAEAGRFGFNVGALVGDYDYKDAETVDGLPVSQQFRNFRLYQGQGEVSYSSGAGPALFVSTTLEARRFQFDIDGFTRDSDSIEVLGGVRSDITPLLRGSVGVGYARANFKDPTIATRGGVSFDVALQYLVTELTTVSFGARRAFKNVSSLTLPAAFAIDASIGVDHELLRNMIVSASATYEDADYVGSSLRVRRYGGQVGALYLIDRHFRLDANLGLRRRDDSGGGRGRRINELSTSVGLSYRL